MDLSSMSRNSYCWDNGVIERFFGSRKSEWWADQRSLTQDKARHDIVRHMDRGVHKQPAPLDRGVHQPAGRADGCCRSQQVSTTATT